jgi:hypothetical protein
MIDFSPLEGALIDDCGDRVGRGSSVFVSTEELRVNMKAPESSADDDEEDRGDGNRTTYE